MMMVENKRMNCLLFYTFFYSMQNIRSILNLANNKLVEGDIQGAITYFETAFTQSQSAEYIGGLFCASKHLGDIYYNTVRE